MSNIEKVRYTEIIFEIGVSLILFAYSFVIVNFCS